MRVSLWFLHQLDKQREHFVPWVVVAFAAGIALYFNLRSEPSLTVWLLIGATTTSTALLLGLKAQRTLLFLLAILIGFSWAGLRTWSVSEPVLSFHYFGPIEGRIIKVDRSASDAVRLTLDQVILRDVSSKNTPLRVRISLHGLQGYLDPHPGQIVGTTGHLTPPGRPVEPGGFDFRRHAWFEKLGAVGFTRVPVLELAGQEVLRELWLQRLRQRISNGFQEMLPGRKGAFAAAITTGDRSGMDQATLEALRASNLAHLLAISGLHMALLTGVVFASIRLLLVTTSLFGVNAPAKKIAAVSAICAGSIYLALSGGNVATERAFIMVLVMFVAVLLDRRAVTLRAVAVAAAMVLTLRPEALVGAGFQMSFAATGALVAVFSSLREWGPHPRWLKAIWGVALSSFVAGLATAPIAAFHFNQLPHYGLLANVVSVPLMGSVIIPGAVISAVLYPVGGAALGTSIMSPAIGWILSVADWVADLPGAVSKVPAAPGIVLALIATTLCWFVLWRGAGRIAAVVPISIALVIWSNAERPALLISESAGLLGYMGENGRSLSKPSGENFAASIWLENDGDPAKQADAHARGGFQEHSWGMAVQVGSQRIGHLTGRVSADQLAEACSDMDLVVTTTKQPMPETCNALTSAVLTKSGAWAIFHPSGRIADVETRAGQRPWTRR